jgi:hypothetical protein
LKGDHLPAGLMEDIALSDQALFYRNVVALNSKRHADTCVTRTLDYTFAAKTNAVYLSLMEFTKAAREYPIVFAGKDDQIKPVALLGLENDHNLFLNEYAAWNADYIPAYVRRYPFILAKSGKEMTVCIDEDCSSVDREGRGERLFDDKGEQSDYLKRMLQFLSEYDSDHKATARFMDILRHHDLLEPVSANVELNSGVKVSLGGFHAISRDRLKKLEAEKLSQLMQSGVMEAIYAHLLSLENFNQLMELFAKKDSEH